MKSNEDNKTWISSILVRNNVLCLKQVYCCLTFLCMYILKISTNVLVPLAKTVVCVSMDQIPTIVPVRTHGLEQTARQVISNTIVHVIQKKRYFLLLRYTLLVHREESPENYCHSPGVVVVVVVVGVVVVVVVVRRQNFDLGHNLWRTKDMTFILHMRIP